MSQKHCRCYFFSSRRRHTSCSRDWSSDVCSSDQIAYGGCDKFYSDFFITAVSPLGFVKNGKNVNYYDDRELLYAVTPFKIGRASCRKECRNGGAPWQ